MPVSPCRANAFERIVVFLAADRARTASTTIARPKPLCPDKSNK
jgi:hypothetical protein